MKTSVHRILRVATAAFLATTAQSCASGTEPRQEPPVVLSELMLDATDPALFDLGFSGVQLGPAYQEPFVDAGCSYDPATQSHLCAPRTVAGSITIERSYILLDAAGSPQSAFSPTTTASVRLKSHLYGTSSVGEAVITFDDRDDRTISGLLTGQRVVNGTSASTHTFATPSIALRTTTSTTRIENLVLPSRSNQWPGPGTVITNMFSPSFIPGAGPDHTEIRMQFNGTKCMTATISFGSFVNTLTIDRSDPSATSCSP